MKSYKIEFTEMQKYVYGVQAKTEVEAIKCAEEMRIEANRMGTYHYHEYGDMETETMVYDVTGTDDDEFLPSTGGDFKEGICVNCGEDITGNRNGQCPFCWNKK